MRRILIVNVNWLGDVLFSTPAIRAIKRRYPGCYLACMAVPRVREILEDNPYLDELIIFDEKSTHRGIFAKLRFISELKKKNFDIVILFHRSFTRTLICLFAGIKERVGYFTGKRGFFLTKSIKCKDRDSIHRVDYFLNLLPLVGIDKVFDKHYDFVVNNKDKVFIESLLGKNNIKTDDFLVVAHVGANWIPKRWPANNFASLLDKLIKELNAKVVITGSKDDLPLADTVVNMMKQQPLVLCGKVTLPQLAALLQIAKVFISADSGPLHIAGAVGTKKIIALFGPTLPEITGPKSKTDLIILQKDVGCRRPCYEVNCSYNRCMQAITAEEVFEIVRKA